MDDGHSAGSTTNRQRTIPSFIRGPASMRDMAEPRRPAATDAAKLDAAASIAQHGRATPARVRVLNALRTSPYALSHQELEQRLGGAIDRVTLYRALDWLLLQGLVHRLAGDDRVWHFSAAGRGAHGLGHAHFRCRDCGRWYCLEAVQPILVLSLPTGFRAEQGELTLSGVCPACAAEDKARE